MTQHLTLNELTQLVRSAIYGGFPDTVWVVAEISDFNLNKSGHCYLELIEKDSMGKSIIARMKAMIWANVFRNVNPFFESITGYKLSSGIKLLVLAQVEFHEVYGLSLNIRDIDPSYTLGDIARRKQETINRLKLEGVFDMNKSIALPEVIQRIAIISSETAAGLGDFLDSLNTNSYKIRFITRLFPAIMQGEKSEKSILNALDEIFHLEENFDVVVLIRGGGAQSELDCFNSYDLAFYITQFPLPVFTGIGHERDETIADLVANTSLKTPTAVADFIISKTGAFHDTLTDYSEALFLVSSNLIKLCRDALQTNSLGLAMSVKNTLALNYNSLDSLRSSLTKSVSFYSEIKLSEVLRLNKLIQINGKYHLHNQLKGLNSLFDTTVKAALSILNRKMNDISNAEQNFEYLNPVNILKRGFTLTYKNGKMIKDILTIKKGDVILTQFSNGRIISRVEEKDENK